MIILEEGVNLSFVAGVFGNIHHQVLENDRGHEMIRAVLDHECQL